MASAFSVPVKEISRFVMHSEELVITVRHALGDS